MPLAFTDTTMDEETEGVIKFILDFRQAEPPPWNHCAALESWRALLIQLGLIGQDPARYGGLAYGNVSIRYDHDKFLISGTQTGALARLSPEQYCIVDHYDPSSNRITAHGPIAPSSEALTHGAAYQASRAIQSVLHVHCPRLWENAEQLGFPLTDPAVAYGTVPMAEEVQRLLKVDPHRVVAMGGHQDGLIATGDSPESAALLLLRAWTRSIQLAPPPLTERDPVPAITPVSCGPGAG